MWTTKTENDSMNKTIVVTLFTGVVYHMDEFHLEVMGNQETQARYLFFYNIKQQWRHLSGTPDGNPCKTLHTSLSSL